MRVIKTPHSRLSQARAPLVALSLVLLVACDDEDEPPGDGRIYVGVIPATREVCPSGTEYVWIKTDDDNKQHGTDSKSHGWVGDVVVDDEGTRFGFCRVPGDEFRSHHEIGYAVLKLSDQCPDGGITVTRQWENQRWYNDNGGGGSLSPNTITYRPASWPLDHHTGWRLEFCYFHPISSDGQVRDFPAINIPYGVFAPPHPSFPVTGWVMTDDADEGWHGPNKNYWQVEGSDKTNSDSNFLKLYDSNLAYFEYVMFGTDYTVLNIGQARSEPYCSDPCPYGGGFDSAHCYLGTPPEGTEAFIYEGSYYYTPVAGNMCPYPGSHFDGANCYLQPVSQNTTPFIYDNNWYYHPCPP